MKARVLTALVLIPVILGSVASANSFWIALLACLAAGIACHELSSITRGENRMRFPLPILAGAALLYFMLVRAEVGALSQLFALTILGILIAPLWVKSPKRILFEVAALWCVAPLLSILMLHELYSPEGALWTLSPVILLLVPLWTGDSLAYFIGRRFGRRALAPRISPKKTWEGAAANVVGCLTASLVVGAVLGVPAWIALASGTLAGVLGQAGDLFESALKRLAQVKDSGSLLPGHGGILDRIDSLLFAAPAQALFLAAFWPPR